MSELKKYVSTRLRRFGTRTPQVTQVISDFAE
jgi:hypothetical protein